MLKGRGCRRGGRGSLLAYKINENVIQINKGKYSMKKYASLM